MWSDRKPWWQRKAKDNAPDSVAVRKNWCVIRVVVSKQTADINSWISLTYGIEYRAVGKTNAPQYYNPDTGKLEKSVEVDNLTKQEAYEVAKGLNFLDGETNDK